MSIPQAPYISALFPTIIQRSHVQDRRAKICAFSNAAFCIVQSIDFKKAVRIKQHGYLLVQVHHFNLIAACFVILIVN
jgi:hypothetical protein